MPLLNKLAKFATSPQGRRLFTKAKDYAQSPQGRAKIAQVQRQLEARRNRQRCGPGASPIARPGTSSTRSRSAVYTTQLPRALVSTSLRAPASTRSSMLPELLLR